MPASRPLRVLALAAYPERMAASRFRILAYRELLAEEGIELTFESWLDDETAAVLYEPGRVTTKARGAARGLAELVRAAAGDWDAVWLQRESVLVGPPIVEAQLLARRIPIVFDVDDAVWLVDTEGHAHKRALKFAWKFDWVMRRSAHVIAGSNELAKRSLGLGVPTSVLPTVVSSALWSPRSEERHGPLTIGWVGTHSTASQLALVAPALRRLRAEGHSFRVMVSGAARDFALEGVPLDLCPWTLAGEVELFRSLDIGVAPSFETPWHEGKCAFKQLQMMAVGVPVVSSWVGGARDFLLDGSNALVARSPDDWYVALRRLLTDAALRERIGDAGRALVEARLCTERQAPRVAQVLRGAAAHWAGPSGR